MSYNLVDPTTGDLTRVAGNSNIVDTAIRTDSTWSSKKISADLGELENITRLTDFDEAIPELGKNKIYYVNKTLGTYKCAQWCVESMYYDVSRLKQYRGVQKATSINGVDNIMLMREYYLDDNNVMRWGDWQQLATTDSTLKTIQLSGSVDCNTLTEPGLYTASANAVISITNTPANIGSAVQLDGGFSILVTKTNVDNVYYGMQMFIPYGSDVPFIRKSYYLNGQYWTDWQQLATMDNITQPIGFKTSLLNQCWGYYTKSGKTISVHMKFVLSSALSDWEPISNTKLPTPSSAITKSANGKTGANNSVYIYTDGAMSQAGGGGMPAGTYEFDFDYTMA